MTYPQQPYGQQPDPYGQGQQPGQYGGYPQQPGSYQQPQGGYQQPPAGQYGYDPTAQYPQYGGFPQGQYGGGFGGPPPPKKKNTGMIVAVAAIVVLLLAGVGITGFVTPGFFLGDDKKNNAGGGSTSSSAPEDSGADEFVDKLVTAADGKDSAALKKLACADAESNVKSAIDDIDEISSAELRTTREVSDSEVTAVLDITVDGDAQEYEASVVKDGGDWCWSDISRSGGSPSATSGTPDPSTGGGSGGGAAAGEQFVQDFLDAVNGGDAATAKGKLCLDSTSQGDIDDAVKGKANLRMDSSNKEAQAEYIGVDLKGTLNGSPTSAARTSAFLEDDGWCIFTFYAF